MYLLLWLCCWLLATVGLRPRRDFADLEQRRKQAAKLFAKGKSQADVARELEVSRQSVSHWYADWQAKGTRGLASAGRAGRLPKLDAAQLSRLAQELAKGASAHGYPTELWTQSRVGEVIEATTGVSYHPGHVWKILHQMGWSRQRPAQRAAERDEGAIERWVAEDWPGIKKTPAGEKPGSVSKTRAGPVSPPP